jgi:hypothetical protein
VNISTPTLSETKFFVVFLSSGNVRN